MRHLLFEFFNVVVYIARHGLDHSSQFPQSVDSCVPQILELINLASKVQHSVEPSLQEVPGLPLALTLIGEHKQFRASLDAQQQRALGLLVLVRGPVPRSLPDFVHQLPQLPGGRSDVSRQCPHGHGLVPPANLGQLVAQPVFDGVLNELLDGQTDELILDEVLSEPLAPFVQQVFDEVLGTPREDPVGRRGYIQVLATRRYCSVVPALFVDLNQ